MKTPFLTVLVCLVTVLTSCGGYPDQVPESSVVTNNNYPVHFLFEHEGCKVYRFSDGTRDVYYTNCNGSTSWQTTKQVGKHRVTEYHNVPTSVNDSIQ